jgi:hypothetical protein
MQRMRVQQQRDWRVGLLGVVITAFEAAIRPSEHHFRH